MCGCTLHLGSPHKNSDLGRCSTRQTTVYSYTASHRSPCIRSIHQHFSTTINMITTIPTHIPVASLYHSKHAISSNIAGATRYQPTPTVARIVVCLLL